MKPKFKVRPANTTAYEGYSTMLHCVAVGDPTPVIHWNKYSREGPLDSDRFKVGPLCVSAVSVSVLSLSFRVRNKLCGIPPQYAPAPCKLAFDLLTLKVVPESRVTWTTSVPILVFLSLSVLELGPVYATDRHTSDRRQTDRRIIA